MGSERRRAELITGRILLFDHVRGYGFVGADDDGEDVFLHASAFDGDPYELVPGRGLNLTLWKAIGDGKHSPRASPTINPRTILESGC